MHSELLHVQSIHWYFIINRLGSPSLLRIFVDAHAHTGGLQSERVADAVALMVSKNSRMPRLPRFMRPKRVLEVQWMAESVSRIVSGVKLAPLLDVTDVMNVDDDDSLMPCRSVTMSQVQCANAVRYSQKFASARSSYTGAELLSDGEDDATAPALLITLTHLSSPSRNLRSTA